MKKANIVLGLGFGDEGKGIVTDYLCSKSYSIDTLVVRFSGGHQAGHTVMMDKNKHIHSSFPSGTLRGYDGYISHHCVISPTHMVNEYLELKHKVALNFKLKVHPLAKVCTPFDIMFNENNIKNRVDGTCGMGVGATMNRHNSTQFKLFAIDLLNLDLIEVKLLAIHRYYGFTLGDKELKKVITDFKNACKEAPVTLVDYEGLNKSKYFNFIFEGSQGIMLDMDFGTIPNVTYASTTSKNALDICKKLYIPESNITTNYVTRSYLSRHGSGWMPYVKDNKLELINTKEEINKTNRFQGELRIQPLNEKLIIHAMSIDSIYNKAGNNNLFITCVDQNSEYNLSVENLPLRIKRMFHSKSPYSSDIIQL